MYEIHGYLTREQFVDLKTRRKHVTLQFSIESAQEEWNKRLISLITNVANEISKKSRRGSASYLITGTPVIDFAKGLTIPLHEND